MTQKPKTIIQFRGTFEGIVPHTKFLAFRVLETGCTGVPARALKQVREAMEEASAGPGEAVEITVERAVLP